MTALLTVQGIHAAAGDGDPNGLELLERCHGVQAGLSPEELDADQSWHYAYCLGYLVGFVSGFAARDATGTGGRFCPPTEARIADFARAINTWLVGNPDKLESMGAAVALAAFQAKFPCPDDVRQRSDQ
ncbi:MAG TPA: Rap1a/Tai family immunity protein [Burkholderiales bacterium]|nr:Rap1a/Tai family immunity protein [Burkholderiales bacterium]